MNNFYFLSKLRKKTNELSFINFVLIITPLVISLILIISNLKFSSNIYKIISVVFIILIISIITHFITDENSYFQDKLGVTNCEDNGYYKAYLNVMIDSLNIANNQMENIWLLSNCNKIDLTPYLKRVEGVFIHLKRLVPPNKYKEYHEDILLELENFLITYKK